jgi:hypothetical protein
MEKRVLRGSSQNKFHYLIRTDGVGVSLIFARRDPLQAENENEASRTLKCLVYRMSRTWPPFVGGTSSESTLASSICCI